ncbi:MAG: (d)CMP kinase [Gemmatimonadales bacterium]
MTLPVIAIDGPSASGKSSTGSAVARQLGWVHLDTGALYRGLTRVALDGGNLSDTRSILAGAEARGLSLSRVGEEVVVMLDGVAAEPVIRTPEVTAAVSEVSALPGVRDWANTRFRAAAEGGVHLVLDGRDIGTAVFPDAPLKIYLTAPPTVRARRRLEQLAAEPSPQALAETTARLTARDLADSTRTVAPLRRAPDAVELDTSALGFAEQVARIVSLARQIWLR